jgi:hypothetical protein
LTYVNGATATANLNQAVYAMLKFTGASAATSVYIPPVSKQYILYNTSGYTITVYNSTVIGNTTAAGSGVSIANGDAVTVWSDGTNVYGIKSSGITGTLPIANGGTGQTTAVAGFNALSTSAVYIDGSSNVGIGTSSPSTYGKLVTVTGDNATTFAAVGATNMLRVQGYNSTYVGTVLEAVNLAQSANTPMFINASQTQFGISGSEKMRIDSSGNVGIGTSSPSTYGAKLAVYSAASSVANIQITNPGVGTGTIGIAAASSNFKIYNSFASATLASGAGIDIDSSGNVGIGTTSPSTRLHASGTDTNPVALRLQNTTASTGKTWQITSTNAGSLQLATIAGVADYLTVDSSGNLLFNSGYGSAATAYGCRAWVNFNGTTATPSTIRGSGNISSITHGATGQYTVNFSSAMPDANYATTGIAGFKDATNNNEISWISLRRSSSSAYSTTQCDITTGFTTSNAGADVAYVCVSFFR